MDPRDQIRKYLEKTIDHLSKKEIGWIRKHPKILERLKHWKWDYEIEKVKGKLQTTYREIEEKSIEMISICWDDQNACDICIYVKDEQVEGEALKVVEGWGACIEPWEWPEYYMGVDVIDYIFKDMEDWNSVIGEEFEMFHKLFYGLVEVAVLESIVSESFNKMNLRKDYSIISFLWHDDNHSVLYDTKEKIDYELFF